MTPLLAAIPVCAQADRVQVAPHGQLQVDVGEGLQPGAELALGAPHPLGDGAHLAVLARQERRDLLAMLVDQVPHPEQDLGPSADARRTPTWKGCLRGSNRRVDLLGGCEVDLSGRLARGRVIDGAPAAARARHSGTVDPVIDPLQLGRVALPGDRRLCDVRHDAPSCARSVYLVRAQPYSARPNPSERRSPWRGGPSACPARVS